MLGTAGISVTFESVSDLLNASAEALAPGGEDSKPPTVKKSNRTDADFVMDTLLSESPGGG